MRGGQSVAERLKLNVNVGSKLPLPDLSLAAETQSQNDTGWLKCLVFTGLILTLIDVAWLIAVVSQHN